jgi:predicted nucleic acid-binding protein
MSQASALLDTDILSELLKQHLQVTHRARVHLAKHSQLAFSIITRYEILRGLKAKRPRLKKLPLTRCVRPARENRGHSTFPTNRCCCEVMGMVST